MDPMEFGITRGEWKKYLEWGRAKEKMGNSFAMEDNNGSEITCFTLFKYVLQLNVLNNL